MTLKVFPQAFWVGEVSIILEAALRAWWGYYLLYYPALQRATSNFNDI